MRIKTQIINPSSLESLLCCVAVGRKLRFTSLDISRLIQQIPPIEGFMNYSISPSGLLIINASENTTAPSALEFLGAVRGLTGKKIVVVATSQEFGRSGRKVYYTLGKDLGKLADLIVALDGNFHDSLQAGIMNARKKVRFHSEKTIQGITDYIQTNSQKRDMCICIGEETQDIFIALNQIQKTES